MNSIFGGVFAGKPDKNKKNNNEKSKNLTDLLRIRMDQIAFRKKMNWLNKVDEKMEEIEEMSTENNLALLWPNGAEMMF